MGIRKGSFYGILLTISIFLSQCTLEDELDTSTFSTDTTYFVECYLKPGELYNLTATNVSPIFEDYILDYSLDFDVFIVDEDTIELWHSLFIDGETGFIYNYGGPRILDIEYGEVFLLVITPTKDTLTAKTKIPDQVYIEDAVLTNDILITTFYTSNVASQNFYIMIANMLVEIEEDSLIEDYEIQYLDLASETDSVLYEVEFINQNLTKSVSTKVTLMRVTEENYDYQLSLEQAKNAGSENITYPSPLEGNIENGVGIFTAYTEDVVEF